MDSSGIITAGASRSSPVGTGPSFGELLSQPGGLDERDTPPSRLAGPTIIRPQGATEKSDEVQSLPDESFLVVEDLSTTTTETGEEVAIVSGNAFETADAAKAFAAERGGAVVLPLSSPRLGARSISGAVFASILLDQRNGDLPNPFSLWTLPDRYVPPAESTATDDHPMAPPGIDGMQDAPVDLDGLAMGKELSRLEAAISQLVLKLEQMLKTMRSLPGSTDRHPPG